jgi:hypothetical protein
MARRKRNPWRKLLTGLKNSAKCSYKEGSRFHDKKVVTVTAEELEDIFLRQNGRCFWLGIKIDPELIYETWNHLAPSLDRIDSEGPYSAENIVITTRFANLGRGRLTMKKCADQIRDVRKAIANEMWPKYLFDEWKPGDFAQMVESGRESRRRAAKNQLQLL